MYRGWQLAPSLQAFSSRENPSKQRFAPVDDLDRERKGGELAFTWEQRGLAPMIIKPFAAYETVKSLEQPSPQDADRYMAGAMAAFSTERTKSGGSGEWGFGAFASIGGAYGRTKPKATSSLEPMSIQHYSDDENDKDKMDNNWNIARLSAGLSLITPAGKISTMAEEGRVGGNFGILDTFHLGGLNVALLPSGPDMNRVQQAALPSFTQSGDRMRKFTVRLWDFFYYEKVAVWNSKGPGPEYLRVTGAQISLDSLLATSDVASFLGATPEFSIGLHRPLDGIMKNRYVFTYSIGFRL